MTDAPVKTGLDVALVVIGGKWKPLILLQLCPGQRRFGELRRLVVGVSEKMLIQQLRELEAHGVIERIDFKELPPKVEYSLTPLGKSLADALLPLCNWGRAHRADIEAIRQHRKVA